VVRTPSDEVERGHDKITPTKDEMIAQHRLDYETTETASFASSGTLQIRDTWRLYLARNALLLVIVVLNAGLAVLILMAAPGPLSLTIIVLFKIRDILAVLWQSALFLGTAIRRCSCRSADEERADARRPLAIASVIPVYKEATADVIHTVDSLLENEHSAQSHLPLLFSDGTPLNREAMFDVAVSTTHWTPYTTWQGVPNALRFHLGLRKDQPVVVVEKQQNAGKKDTLILAFNLLNHAASASHNAEVHAFVDLLNAYELPTRFDYLVNTDADTVIGQGSVEACLRRLEAESENTVACCGMLLVDFSKQTLSGCGFFYFWDHFQGMQYLCESCGSAVRARG